MPNPYTPPVSVRDPRRWLRATLLGSSLTALTLAGHTAAGGRAHAIGIGLVLLLSVLFGATLSRGRLRAAPVLAVLVGGQLLLHVILTFTGAHGHHGAWLPTGTMLIAHVTAAAVATIVILHADRLADAWHRFLSVLLGAAVAQARGATGRRQQATRPAAEGAHHPAFARGVLIRRGPPPHTFGLLAH